MNSGKLSVLQSVRGHWETVIPYLFRKIKLPDPQILEIPLRDQDFIDSGFWKGGKKGLAILTHGLEGNIHASYIRVLVRLLIADGYDVLAWNFRGCSGRMNKNSRLYHSGAYEDLQDVIQFAFSTFKPENIQLYGFSLGGNLTLVTVAKSGKEWLDLYKVNQATVISPPLDLAASAKKLGRFWNKPYAFNFLIDLKRKIRLKAKQFPNDFNLSKLNDSKTIIRFDDHFTAPLHGFVDAEDYYNKCSSRFMLEELSIPSRIILSKNDPMLARGFLQNLKVENRFVRISIFETGGHCGFQGWEKEWISDRPLT